MHRNNGSFEMILMAVLTLGAVMLLPVVGSLQSSSLLASDTPDTQAISPNNSALELGRTTLVYVDGGLYTRGTDADEIDAAINACLSQTNTTCETLVGTDAIPAHPVSVSGYWMETTEVTYAQYVNFLNTLRGHSIGCAGQLCALTTLESETSNIVYNGSSYAVSSPAYEDYPVTQVSWYGAQAYCEALGRRLPTEAEWEYAARGRDGWLYPWGDDWQADAANVRGVDADGASVAPGVQPVGTDGRYASRDGVRDLAGNVSEWTADWYAADAYAQPEALIPDPLGPATGETRVVRGGAWSMLPFYARAVQRQHFTPQTTSSSIGFRCVLDG